MLFKAKGSHSQNATKKPTEAEATAFSRINSIKFDKAVASKKSLYDKARNWVSSNDRMLATMNQHLKRLEMELLANDVNLKQYRLLESRVRKQDEIILTLQATIEEMNTNLNYLISKIPNNGAVGL